MRWVGVRYNLTGDDYISTPNGIRIHATALKGRRPGPLDDGGHVVFMYRNARAFSFHYSHPV